MGYLWAQWAIQGHGLSMGYNCGAHIGTMWVLHGQMFMGKNMGYNNGAHMGTLWVLYGQMVMGKYVGPTRATWTKSLWGPCGQPKRAPQLQPMVCPCGPHMGMLAGDRSINIQMKISKSYLFSYTAAGCMHGVDMNCYREQSVWLCCLNQLNYTSAMREKRS